MAAASPFRLSLVTAQTTPTFGFYFPIFDLVSGVLRVVSQVRTFYPEAPILLLSDGGNLDFTGVCKLPKYSCKFQWVQAENSRWNPHSWFRRMRDATKTLGTDYIIYLEPDVEVKQRHSVEPQDDAGGVFDNFNPGMKPETIAYLERLGRERNANFRIRWPHFGLTGGSYFRKEAIFDAFDEANVA